MRRNLRLSGDYAGVQFEPLPWFAEFLRAVFGQLTPDGLRKILTAYLELGKGNAKTTSLAALFLFATCTRRQPGFKCFSLATSKDQAAELFDAMEGMISASPRVKPLIKPVRSMKVAYRYDDPSIIYRALASDGGTADGKAPQMVVCDELHLWKTPRQKMLYEVMYRGGVMKAKNPLWVEITTAGQQDDSPICWPKHEYTVRWREGLYKNDRFYGRIYAADGRRLAAEPEWWTTKEAFIQANPSHVSRGGHLKDDTWRTLVQEAIEQPEKRPAYMRYHLGYWGSADGAVIDYEKWLSNSGGEDLNTWPVYDTDLLMSKWNLVGKPCYLGLDYGSTSDMTALVALFPPEKKTARNPNARTKWAILAWYWMPEEKMPIRERQDQVPYLDWAEKGFIIRAKGARTNTDVIIPKVEWCQQMFIVRQMGYDPDNAESTVAVLRDEHDIDAWEVPQHISHLNEPTKWLLAAYKDQLLMHANNPVLGFNARNLALDHNSADNVKPVKVINRQSKKIDGISALVCAIHRAMADADADNSYDGYLKDLIAQ